MSAPNHRDRKQVTLGVVGDGGRMPRYVLDLEAVASNHVILAAALCVVAGCGAVVFGRLRARARASMGTSWLLVGLFAAGAAGFQFAVVSSEPTPPVSPLTGQPVSPPWYDGWLLAGVYPRSMSMYHVASLTLLMSIAAIFLGLRLALGGEGQKAASGIALVCLALTIGAGTAIVGADIQWDAAFRTAAAVGVLAAVVLIALHVALRRRWPAYRGVLSQTGAICCLLCCTALVGIVCLLNRQVTPLDMQLSLWQRAAAYTWAWGLFGVMLCVGIVPPDASDGPDHEVPAADGRGA